MKLVITSPTKAWIIDATSEENAVLRRELTYTNTAQQHLVKRHYNNKYFRERNHEAWAAQLDEMKKTVQCTVLFYGQTPWGYDGFYIRPGSIPYLKALFPDMEIENKIKYPSIKKVAWAKPLPFELHEYQQKTAELLQEIKHGNGELCTGAGKSAIILKICRETGLKAAIIAPSKSIFNELREKFEHHFGKAQVGSFGDGKKKLGKRFTICIADSIANIQRDTPEWEFFHGLDMIIADESHTWGAETLDTICHGVLEDVPYRLFLSGTQTRGDGAEKLLQSIIGRTVYKLSTADAVKGGFISEHEFRVVRLESSQPSFYSSDALAMKRTHFLGNKNILAFVTKLCKASAANKMQTLVLVEELSQISNLVRTLGDSGVTVAYAHSESKKERLLELGLEKVDPAESVERFNKGEAMVLIGTSCISTGTNIYPTHSTVNWVGGASEIKTKQGAVGRSVRLGNQNPWASKCTPKTKAIIWDFDVYDIDIMKRHLDQRLEYYMDSGSEIKTIKLK